MSKNPEKNLESLFRTISIQAKRLSDKKLDTYGLNGQQGRMISYIASQEDRGVIQRSCARSPLLLKWSRNGMFFLPQ